MPDENTEKALKNWITKIGEETKDHRSWASGLREMRVDVNEAINAVSDIKPTASDKEKRRRFYECLFVGRQLDSDLVNKFDFERCTFVRTAFLIGQGANPQCTACHLIDCEIDGQDGAVTLKNCVVIGIKISSRGSMIFEARSSQIDGMTLPRTKDLTLKLLRSEVVNAVINSDYPLIFIGDTTEFAATSFSRATLSSELSVEVHGIRPHPDKVF